MSHTVKHHINNYIAAGLVFLLISPVLAQAEDESTVTPIQLRAMQTRKFNKTIVEVGDAIKTGGEDRNQSCIFPSLDTKGIQKVEGSCRPKTKGISGGATAATTAASMIPFIGGFVAMGVQQKAMDDMYAQIAEVKFNIIASKPNETVVRMRIYDMKREQLVDPELYSKEFKAIGDALFVQAIELTPAEQQ